jgi:hypothetical protein
LVAVGRDILAGAITSVRVALFATDPRSSPWPSKVIRPTDARYTGTEVNSFGDVNSELPLARNTKLPLRLESEYAPLFSASTEEHAPRIEIVTIAIAMNERAEDLLTVVPPVLGRLQKKLAMYGVSLFLIASTT